MSTITREQAQKIIEAADEVFTALAGTNEDVHPESDNMLRLWDDLNDRYAPPEVVRELARIALASLEAEPIGAFHISEQQVGGTTDYIKDGEWPIDDGVIEVYTAPPAPVTLPDLKELEAILDWILMLPCPTPKATHFAKRLAVVIDTCRAAMLHGAAGNSPAIPDGYALVPVEPTEKMVIEGFESEPDEFFSDAKVWEAYDAMSGCQQAAHRAKLCWAAMLAAAPQQEVK